LNSRFDVEKYYKIMANIANDFLERGHMRLRKTIAIYSIFVGVAMLGIWIVQLRTGQAPELQTAPIEIAMAITADWLTATLLLVVGVGLLSKRSWAYKLYFFALGMLAYSVLISSGYFGQSGDTIFVVLFAVLFVLSAVFVISNILQKSNE
jgi:hypothetical protein